MCLLLYVVYNTSRSFPKLVLEPCREYEKLSPLNRYSVWPSFQPPTESQSQHTWYRFNCVPTVREFSIANLGTILSEWSKSTDVQCRKLLSTFQTIYAVSLRNGSVSLPVPFQAKVKKWLGNNEELFKDVFHQEIIHVVNKLTREHTVFNPLRDKRPVSLPDVPEAQYYEQLMKDSAKSCDFCDFKGYTAEHTFHRVENEFAFSASNTFKMDTLHALFAMKQHDPLRWSAKMFIGLMNLTLTWFDKAHGVFPSARFPSMIWDVLPKCGASQVHPHLHGFLDPERYHGVSESWRLGGQDYFNIEGTNLFTDMAQLASSLGLAVSYKSAVAFASLVPRKDHEVVVMAPVAGRDFFEMIYFVLRAFVDDLPQYCFSMGITYPALSGMEAVLPAYARIITRGAVTDLRADISSLELFTATNVNIDPFRVIKVVRESVQKRQNEFKLS